MDYFVQHRKLYIEIGRVYFWTATINGWYKLMEEDAVKQIITDSLRFFIRQGQNRCVCVCCYAKLYSPHLENK